MTPTDEQVQILDLVRSSDAPLLINSYAGTGKTTMLEMIHEVCPKSPILYVTFANRNVKEARERLLKRLEANSGLPPIEIKTLNGLGYGVWRSAIPRKCNVDKDKTKEILKTHISELPKKLKAEAAERFAEVCQGISMAKALGYIPEGFFPGIDRLCDFVAVAQRLDEEPDDYTRELINAVLVKSINAAYEGYIDFDDQLYMPALFGGTWPSYPIALLDERQDFSPINNAMLRHLTGTRMVAVGDPWQSIYAFRGADTRSMAILSQTPGMSCAELSVSFRCPSEIVRNVHWRVPQMRWSREGGRVVHLDSPTYLNGMDGSTAIICRNNAPLFRLAVDLLSHGRGCTVVGSDVGPRLTAIMRKLADADVAPLASARAVEAWREDKLRKGSKVANDLADCMLIFIRQTENLGQAIFYLEDLLAQRGSLTLLTGHKAKGLEWDNVYHLNPGLCGQDDQDLNLRYVISTRAKDTLYEINQEMVRT